MKVCMIGCDQWRQLISMTDEVIREGSSRQRSGGGWQEALLLRSTLP